MQDWQNVIKVVNESRGLEFLAGSLEEAQTYRDWYEDELVAFYSLDPLGGYSALVGESATRYLARREALTV